MDPAGRRDSRSPTTPCQGAPLHPGARWLRPRYAGNGDVIVATVKDAIPGGITSRRATSSRRSSLRYLEGVGVRPDGFVHPFDRERRGDPQERRRAARHCASSAVGRELRDKKYMRINTLAPGCSEMAKTRRATR